MTGGQDGGAGALAAHNTEPADVGDGRTMTVRLARPKPPLHWAASSANYRPLCANERVTPPAFASRVRLRVKRAHEWRSGHAQGWGMRQYGPASCGERCCAARARQRAACRHALARNVRPHGAGRSAMSTRGIGSGVGDRHVLQLLAAARQPGRRRRLCRPFSPNCPGSPAVLPVSPFFSEVAPSLQHPYRRHHHHPISPSPPSTNPSQPLPTSSPHPYDIIVLPLPSPSPP